LGLAFSLSHQPCSQLAWLSTIRSFLIHFYLTYNNTTKLRKVPPGNPNSSRFNLSLNHDKYSCCTVTMADRYIPEHRRTQFKAKSTFKPEELRRRREEQQVEIRKAKREENLAKRRGLTGDGSSVRGAALGAAPESDDDTAPTESQVRDKSLELVSISLVLPDLVPPFRC
jgi:hypothetical protein